MSAATLRYPKRIWIPVTLVLLATAAIVFAALGRSGEQAFRATARIAATVTTTGSAEDGFYAGSVASSQIRNLKAVAGSSAVLDPVAKALGVGGGDALKPWVTADIPVGTTMLEIRATDPDPKRAKLIADGVAAQLVQRSHDLQSATTTTVVQVVQPAEAEVAGSTGTLRTLITAVALGALVALPIALFLRWQDRRVRSEEQLAGAPVIGRVSSARPEDLRAALVPLLRTMTDAQGRILVYGDAPDSSSAKVAESLVSGAQQIGLSATLTELRGDARPAETPAGERDTRVTVTLVPSAADPWTVARAARTNDATVLVVDRGSSMTPEVRARAEGLLGAGVPGVGYLLVG